jgi:hypothetical protein
MRRRALELSVLVVCLLTAISCARSYRVLPQTPSYVLKSPDHRETAFRDILQNYNGFERGFPSVDLRPGMGIRVENAYYEKGASRKGLKGYMGTEVAGYEVTARGLQLVSVIPMKNRPESDLPVENLILPAHLKFRYYRLYFEILFDRKKDEHGSVLLAADSLADLNHLSDQLSDPEKVCGATSTQCTVFPEACSVSVEMNIVVNGKPQLTNWGSLLSSVVTNPPRHLAMKRLYGARLTAVKIDPQDSIGLSLALLPGDQIVWD